MAFRIEFVDEERFELSGPLKLGEATPKVQQLTGHLQGHRHMTLDLRGVTGWDSAGVGSVKRLAGAGQVHFEVDPANTMLYLSLLFAESAAGPITDFAHKA